jgi:hypothetical protein
MKISVDVDCTPEEARRFMGLPDLSGVHAVYLGKLERMVEEGVSSESVEAMLRAWAPMGEAGMNMWRKMFEDMGGSGKR